MAGRTPEDRVDGRFVDEFQVLDLPPVPGLSTFPETNVRTYVRAAEPWPLVRADVLTLEEDLLAAAELHAPSGPPRVQWSPGVHASLGKPRTVPA